jgi:uncharacterized protein YjbI with pentapeptide repeats
MKEISKNTLKKLTQREFNSQFQSGIKDFSKTDLRDLDLSNLNLTSFNFTKANLNSANLSCSNLENAILFGTHLENAILLRTNLRHANLTSAKLFRADFTEANLDNANLHDARVTSTNFSRSSLVKARLTYLNSESFLDDTPLSFKGANLSGADLSRGKLKTVILDSANLTDASLSYLKTENATFVNADLTKANLESMELLRANFTGATLVNANLNNSSLFSANFDGADFSGAVLSKTNFYKPILNNAKFTGVIEKSICTEAILFLLKDGTLSPNQKKEMLGIDDENPNESGALKFLNEKILELDLSKKTKFDKVINEIKKFIQQNIVKQDEMQVEQIAGLPRVEVKKEREIEAVSKAEFERNVKVKKEAALLQARELSHDQVQALQIRVIPKVEIKKEKEESPSSIINSTQQKKDVADPSRQLQRKPRGGNIFDD